MVQALINPDCILMKFYRKLLFPLVLVYWAVTWIRNTFYDMGLIKSVSFDFPVICVGNLSVGGTGKTPMIEYLINLLRDDVRIAVLSRGYRRKTKGFYLANRESSVDILGDEPFQFYSKFKDDIQVAVDSDRVNGIKILRSTHDAPEVILLDDAFQHRKVKAGFNVLLTTFDAIYTKDFVLPAGNLREPKIGAKRADIIVVTKCPAGLNDVDKHNIVQLIKPLKRQSVFFSNITYADSVTLLHSNIKLDEVSDFTLVTGIANPKPLVDYLKSKQLRFEHLNFPDHYDFSQKDVEELNKKQLILTTEKDYMRLQKHDVLKQKLGYLPIQLAIHDSDKLDRLIKQFLASKM